MSTPLQQIIHILFKKNCHAGAGATEIKSQTGTLRNLLFAASGLIAINGP